MFGKNWFVRRLTEKEMSPKLDYATGMDEIQRPLSAILKGAGPNPQLREARVAHLEVLERPCSR
jgi:hypothetical protein